MYDDDMVGPVYVSLYGKLSTFHIVIGTYSGNMLLVHSYMPTETTEMPNRGVVYFSLITDYVSVAKVICFICLLI
jgi:hypothetical protein